MRISKEISGNADRETTGQGRGEYEYCDLTDDDPTQDQLIGKRIVLRLPNNARIDTGCVFAVQGGKNRIRTADGVDLREVYPIWHVAGLLLLPRPNRDERRWGEGLPVMRNGQYGISHLHMARTSINGEEAVLEIDRVDVRNHYTEESINFRERFEQVQSIWQGANSFDEDVRELLQQHEELVRNGEPTFGHGSLLVVQRLQERMSENAADYNIEGVTPTTDVLPSLLEGIDASNVEPPPSVDDIPDDEVLIRKRDVKKWRRWAVARGGSAVRFRREVRNAYRSTCVVCGIQLPAIGPGMNPGVDSAHILPWANFELDEVSNGLCLCKLHHWAFDEGIIEIISEDENYVVRVNTSVAERIEQAGVEFSIDVFRAVEGTIPVERLPDNSADWPNPLFLLRLQEINDSHDS